MHVPILQALNFRTQMPCGHSPFPSDVCWQDRAADLDGLYAVWQGYVLILGQPLHTHGTKLMLSA
jgi:hypothetical protein